MTNALMTALAKAQQEFAPIVKNKKNYNKGTYADLTAILEAVKPALLAHGIVILQSPVTRYLENNLFVVDIVTTICHGESGETFEGVLSMPAKNDAQAIGSAITYGRRYALVSMLSLSTEDDDDGEEAIKPAQPRQQPQRQAPTQRQPEPPATNGNGNGHKPAAEAPKKLPFERVDGAEVHYNAIEWAMTQGVFNATQHAQNSYKKLSGELKHPGASATREQTDALLWAWVDKVNAKVAEKTAEAEDNPFTEEAQPEPA